MQYMKRDHPSGTADRALPEKSPESATLDDDARARARRFCAETDLPLRTICTYLLSWPNSELGYADDEAGEVWISVNAPRMTRLGSVTIRWPGIY